ncbi:MAG: GAF domain-containing protein [Deltaproteobacteria bacterium]|nr:GAF domain-containing protein [Deltaproteobacteria bacterium]
MDRGQNKETVASLKRQISQQEARLATYKETLEEIYSLYDTRIEELSFIRRLSDSLRIGLDLKKVCLGLVDIVMEELAPDLSLLLLIDRRGRLKIKASAGLGQPAVYWPDKDPIQSQAPQLGQGPLSQVLHDGKPLLVADLDGGRGLLQEARSLVCLPLISRQEKVGLLALAGHSPGAFSQKEVRVLTIICDQAAAVLYNVRLINELKRVNQSLRRSEREALLARDSWERLLENANDLILTVDQAGLISYVNRKVKDLGLDPADVIGRPLTALISPLNFDPAKLRPSASSRVEELPVKEAQGGTRTALVSFTPLPPGGRDDPALLVIARDITERKHLERQLFHSEKLASVGLLAAGVAHEIGNPLSAIAGYAQILKKQGVSNQAGQEFIRAIEDQAGRIETIIQELLAYSRPSTGVRSRLKVNEASLAIVSMLTNQKLFRGVEVQTSLDPAEPEIFMDRDLLAQVLINLMVNAAQALAGSGRISIATEARTDQVTIRVADTGPGVAPETASRIFDPFFTTKPVGQGTGLGLSICHRIVEGEGGLIRLAQDQGPGAVFEVILPRAKEEA